MQLGEIDPGTFEELIGELLERIGFEDVEVTEAGPETAASTCAEYSQSAALPA